MLPVKKIGVFFKVSSVKVNNTSIIVKHILDLTYSFKLYCPGGFNIFHWSIFVYDEK